MKNKTSAIAVLLLSLLITAYPEVIVAQYPGINDSITRHRKGSLVIKAKRGDKITVEQLSHEFWFGCAISNGLGTGSTHRRHRRSGTSAQ